MRYLSLLLTLLLCSCATPHKTYQPPDATKLKVSTQRVSKAVDQAHASARKAQTQVNEAAKRQKEIETETKALENVPVTLLGKINDQDTAFTDIQETQTELEKSLQEADLAKSQVEKDKVDYFNSAQKLADAATQEREARIKDENSLHWYRMHFFLGWIILISGIIACVVFALIKFGVITWFKIP